MIAFRAARRGDLPAIIALLADDELGAARESCAEPVAAVYEMAFDAIARQEGNTVIVAVEDDVVVGCLQLTFIPGLSRSGMMRAQIEGVRVASQARGRGIGELLMRDAIARARQHGCGLVQLTTDQRRTDAHAFYERLGFRATHLGMKLPLEAPS